MEVKKWKTFIKRVRRPLSHNSGDHGSPHSCPNGSANKRCLCYRAEWHSAKAHLYSCSISIIFLIRKILCFSNRRFRGKLHWGWCWTAGKGPVWLFHHWSTVIFQLWIEPALFRLFWPWRIQQIPHQGYLPYLYRQQQQKHHTICWGNMNLYWQQYSFRTQQAKKERQNLSPHFKKGMKSQWKKSYSPWFCPLQW